MILRIVVHITAMSLLWENFVEPWAAQFYHQFNKKNINTVLKPMIKKNNMYPTYKTQTSNN